MLHFRVRGEDELTDKNALPDVCRCVSAKYKAIVGKVDAPHQAWFIILGKESDKTTKESTKKQSRRSNAKFLAGNKSKGQ